MLGILISPVFETTWVQFLTIIITIMNGIKDFLVPDKFEVGMYLCLKRGTKLQVQKF